MSELTPEEMYSVEQRGEHVLDQLVAVMLQQGMTQDEIAALDDRVQTNILRLAQVLAHMEIETERRLDDEEKG